MQRIATCLTLLALLPVTSSVWAKTDEAPLFQPTSQWAIDYADHSCRLIRNFSNGQEQITLAFERFMPGPALRLGIAGDALSFSRTTKSLTIILGPNKPEQEGALLVSELADGRKSYLVAVPALTAELAPHMISFTEFSTYSEEKELAAARSIDSLRLIGSFERPTAINLGPMDKPIQALQGCVAELMHEWGVDGDKRPPMRPATPIGYPGAWVDARDYPSAMLAQHRQGVVGVRLVVNEIGAVDKCFVDVDKPGPFEEAVCHAIIKRAHFEPAIDADGKPMRSLYTTTVRFQLP